MSIPDAVARLRDHARDCEGVKYAPDAVKESVTVFPFAVVYPERGEIMGESATLIHGLHTIIVEFHCARNLLETAIETATGYIEEFGAKLVEDPTLNETVSTILMGADQNVVYEFGRLEWAGEATVGVRFHVPVKIRGAV